MAITYGIIGTALNPAATTETEFIVCPVGHEYTGTVRICNIGTVSADYRLAHTPVAGAANSEDWDAYDTELEPGETDDLTMEMAAGETLRVYASNSNFSFKFSGMDIDNA